MTRFKNTLVLICVMLSSIAYSQGIRFSIQSGIGTYDMEGLKGINEQTFKSLPFQARIISNYPSYIYYKPGVELFFNRLSIGVQTSFNSTGSRISSKDYSGEYLYDTQISCIAPGLYSDYLIFSLFEKYKVSIAAEGGAVFSTFNLKENLTVNEEELSNSDYTFKATNYYLEPGLKVETTLVSFISIGLNGGYVVQFGKSKLETGQGGVTNMRPDWSGFRVGLSLVFTPPYE